MSPLRGIVRRWPAALGLAFGVFLHLTDDLRSIWGVLLPLMIAFTGYAVIAALQRPRWSWPVIAVLVVGIFAARAVGFSQIAELAGMVMLVLIVCIAGSVRGTWAQPNLYRWQPLGAIVFVAVAFAAVALVSLAFAPELGLIVVAAGLIGHGVWDVVHWRRHEVVAPSLAEWCAVLDLTLGVGILLRVL